MSAPVWILSVDLQTKTATFQSGLADAARSARSSFRDINAGAAEMGDSVGRGSLDVRHALGLVDNTIRGAHSMAMVDLIRMFKDSALVMGALPFAMTVAGFALIGEIVYKGVQAYEAYRQAQEKLRDDTTKLHTSIQDVFNGLDTKILQAEKQTDELRGDHLGALRKELDLIDRQSMEDLKRSFNQVAEATDKFFGDLKTSWYQFGTGSEGAMHALDQFKVQYEALLTKGQDKDASNLLSGTLTSARHILAMMEMVRSDEARLKSGGRSSLSPVEQMAGTQALNDLKSAGVGWTDKEMQSQQAIVDALNAQVEVEQKVNALKNDDKGNARMQTTKDMTRQSDELANRLREGKALYIRDLYEQYTESRQEVEDGERQNIDATKAGSEERLAVLEQTLEDEKKMGLDGTKFYQQLTLERIATIRQMSEEQDALNAESAKEDATHAEKVAELKLAAQKQAFALEDSLRRTTLAQRAAQDQQIADAEYQIKLMALQKEVDALDKSGKDYQNKLKQMQDQERQLTLQHENEIGAIKQKAVVDQNRRILAAEQQQWDAIARGLTQSMMGHQSWARMIDQLGSQVVSGMMENAIKSALADDFTKEKDAAKAARTAFNIGLSMGGPAGIVLGPVFGAAAFASVMAFAQGGIVPGVDRGDVVPAMLTPGEGVVPRGVMDSLSKMSREGGFNSKGETHLHVHANFSPQVHALDSDGVDEVLTKHADKFQKHFERTLKKMNR